MFTTPNAKTDQGILTAICLCKDEPNNFKTTTVDYNEAKEIFFAESNTLHVGEIIKTPERTLEIIDIQIELLNEIRNNKYGFDKSWTGAILPNNFIVKVIIKEI